ncbi:hypothetical protein E2C01_003626 [Portunus trituberculatus]|uniref:Uncharacterized protein n=1 Tax=Portunus trituberculatus TaxID=210409 RepID=A0A5B7CPA1_PORTR|nr:hypothetical protein [Portunus trituberculatus]
MPLERTDAGDTEAARMSLLDVGYGRLSSVQLSPPSNGFSSTRTAFRVILDFISATQTAVVSGEAT